MPPLSLSKGDPQNVTVMVAISHLTSISDGFGTEITREVKPLTRNTFESLLVAFRI